MKLPFLLVIAAALFAFSMTASAEDKPAAPPPPAPTTPAADAEKAPVARKEEEEEGEQKEAKEAAESNEAARKGFFAKLFSKEPKKKEAADEAAALRAENEQLKQRVSALEATIEDQKKQLAYIDDNWPAIEAALSKGDDKAPALQTEVGKKIAAAVATGTAAAITSAGHDPQKLSGPGAKKPGAKADDKELPKTAFSQIREHFSSQGYEQPGLNQDPGLN